MNCSFSPLAKVLKIDGQYYGYDAASSLLCELDEVSAGCLSSDRSAPVPEALGKLLERGVFMTPDFKQCTVNIEDLPKMIAYNMEHTFPKRFVLEVTESCNLRCKYCFNTIGDGNRVHTSRQMDEETAFAAIDYYFKCFTAKLSQIKDTDRKDYLKKMKPVFSLWGGEPFLNFKLIQKAKAYFDSLPWKDFCVDAEDIICSIVTNFTIFNDEILDFLVRNKILLSVSFDGSRYAHDMNRVFADGHGSFDIVKSHLDKLYSIASDYCHSYVLIQAVYDGRESLKKSQSFFKEFLYDEQQKKKFIGIFYIHQSKPKEQIDFSFSDEEKKRSVELFKEKLAELSLLSEAELDKKVHTGEIIINDYLVLLKKEKKLRFDKPIVSNHCARTFSCPIGTSQIAVGTTGDLHVCYKSDESYPIGNVKTGGLDAHKLARMYSEYYANFQSNCKKCWAYRFCQKCPSEMLKNGKFIEASREECDFVRNLTEVELLKYILLASNDKLYNFFKRYISSYQQEIVYV